MNKKKILKYFIAGTCIKASIMLLQADRGLEHKINDLNCKELEQERRCYDTTNIKKDYLLYYECKED